MQVVEHSIGLNEDKQIINGLKATVLELCDNFREDYDPVDLLQRTQINCEGDQKLFEAFKGGIQADYNESSLKKSVIAIRSNWMPISGKKKSLKLSVRLPPTLPITGKRLLIFLFTLRSS